MHGLCSEPRHVTQGPSSMKHDRLLSTSQTLLAKEAPLLPPLLHLPPGQATGHVSSEPAGQWNAADYGLANEVRLDEVRPQQPNALASCDPMMITTCSDLAETAGHRDYDGHIGISPPVGRLCGKDQDQQQLMALAHTHFAHQHYMCQGEDTTLTCGRMQYSIRRTQ